MRSVPEHQQHVNALFAAPRTVTLPASEALGRVLAEDVTATLSLPGFDNSAMDGYAVRAEDIAGATDGDPVTLAVAQDIPAGRTDHLTLSAGTAHRIMTGAPLPGGADAVVQVEKTDGGVDEVRIYAAVDTGAAIRSAGSDISPGHLALTAGRVLHAPQLGLLAALGLSHIRVYAPLRVLVLSTGSELVPAGTPLDYGQIYESNGAMLTAAATEAGAFAEQVHFVPDSVDEFRARLDEYVDREQGADLIITSGGVSAGAYEVVKDALTGHGVEFTKVAMQPGMPQGCGHYTSAAGTAVPIVTLPGNPVSAQVSFEVFVRPPLRAAMGLPRGRRTAHAQVTESFTSPRGKRQFRRGELEMAGTGAIVRPIGPPGSHHLAFMASANALLDIAADVEHVEAGSTIEVLLLED
ncbi:molybdopterin molybdenumtransferase [Williamsia sp. 1138]|uniref:molybdopterin molybdotransferase MoeA n=1 Tax=Williamsia sp. 1138 TaxID=1903117 RepID=UPI000A0F847D|nr:gephyrin-like molybdotransferase Glp [Williamsia sp. 1138]OZG26300.1 molybdopterin molybdenumtransferase [Williamsia sp. 1138]